MPYVERELSCAWLGGRGKQSGIVGRAFQCFHSYREFCNLMHTCTMFRHYCWQKIRGSWWRTNTSRKCWRSYVNRRFYWEQPHTHCNRYCHTACLITIWHETWSSVMWSCYVWKSQRNQSQKKSCHWKCWQMKLFPRSALSGTCWEFNWTSVTRSWTRLRRTVLETRTTWGAASRCSQSGCHRMLGPVGPH